MRCTRFLPGVWLVTAAACAAAALPPVEQLDAHAREAASQKSMSAAAGVPESDAAECRRLSFDRSEGQRLVDAFARDAWEDYAGWTNREEVLTRLRAFFDAQLSDLREQQKSAPLIVHVTSRLCILERQVIDAERLRAALDRNLGNLPQSSAGLAKRISANTMDLEDARMILEYLEAYRRQAEQLAKAAAQEADERREAYRADPQGAAAAGDSPKAVAPKTLRLDDVVATWLSRKKPPLLANATPEDITIVNNRTADGTTISDAQANEWPTVSAIVFNRSERLCVTAASGEVRFFDAKGSTIYQERVDILLADHWVAMSYGSRASYLKNERTSVGLAPRSSIRFSFEPSRTLPNWSPGRVQLRITYAEGLQAATCEPRANQ